MRVLYIDLLCEYGHRSFNENMIRVLKKTTLIDVAFIEDYIDVIDLDESEIICIPSLILKYKNRFDYRFKQLKVIRWMSKFINENNKKYNAVIISGYDTISLAIGLYVNSIALPVYVINHNNPDQLESAIKKFLFRSMSKKISHIVFENYIKDYLTNKIGIDSEKIHVVKHPLSNSMKNTELKKSNLIIGLSNSNDEAFIKKIVDYENEYGFCQDNKIEMVLKSKRHIQFDNGYLKVINGYLTRQEYNNYYYKSKIVLVPFQNSFKYRVSGTLLDALTSSKIVIGNNILLMKVFKRKFSHICYTYSSVEELMEIILKLINKNGKSDDFNKFLEEYSDNYISQNWKEILEKTLEIGEIDNNENQ